MSGSDWQQIRDLFEAALELPPKDRQRFLNEARGLNQEIRAEITKLLEADSRPTEISFLDNPILEWADMEQSNPSSQPIELPFMDEDRKKYRILGEIGRGGMGVIYLASSLDRGDKVAIKVMKSDLSQEDLRRFEDERKILVKLDDHQHIVTFLSRGMLRDSRPYFVMKYVKGESLEDRLKKGGLSFQQIAEITDQLGKTLAFAHRNGVIHRDIKPSNIMLSELDGGLCVKVLDFGIAILRGLEDNGTKDFTLNIMCTPAYASPEQLQGKRRDEIDHRSDIFSLGCVVYEMLTASHPFIITNQIIRRPEKPLPPSEVRPDLRLSREIDNVLLKAMALSPEERYNSAREFAEEFQAALFALEFIETIPAPVPPRKPGGRQKYLLPIIAILILAAGGGAALQLLNNAAPQSNVNESFPKERANNNSRTDENENRSGPSESQSPQPDIDIQLIQVTTTGGTSVPFQTVFASGDAVRWSIKPVDAGYLYIVFKGNSGNVSIFYPYAQDTDSYQQTLPGKSIVYPKNDMKIRFDSRPGEETYYFVFAAQKGEPVLAELENAVAQRRATLNESDGQKLLEVLQARSESKAPGPLVRVLALQHK